MGTLHVLPTARVGFTCCGARTREHRREATAAGGGVVIWCCCWCGLATRTHAHKTCPPSDSGKRVYPVHTYILRKETAGCAGPDLYPLDSDRAQSPSTTSHILQRGFSATPAKCSAALYDGDCLSVRAAKAVSLCLARVTSRHVLCHVSASGQIIAPPPITDVCSQQTPYKTRVSLVELGRISRYFMEHFEKIRAKMFLRCRVLCLSWGVS